MKVGEHFYQFLEEEIPISQQEIKQDNRLQNARDKARRGREKGVRQGGPRYLDLGGRLFRYATLGHVLDMRRRPRQLFGAPDQLPHLILHLSHALREFLLKPW